MAIVAISLGVVVSCIGSVGLLEAIIFIFYSTLIYDVFYYYCKIKEIYFLCNIQALYY